LEPGGIDDLVSDFSRFYILTILYEGPEHGYGILRKFHGRIGKKISPGLVYPFLQQLEEKRLISVEVEMIGNKEKKLYTLTDEGRRFCNALFRRFAGLVNVAIEPSLTVCAHCGCKIYEGGSPRGDRRQGDRVLLRPLRGHIQTGAGFTRRRR